MLKTLGLEALWRELAILYLEWAQRSMCQSHPDIPYVVLRLNYWRDQRGKS